VKVLIAVGAINGLILPFALGIILSAALKKNIYADYRHPKWLSVIGWAVVMVMTYMGAKGIMAWL